LEPYEETIDAPNDGSSDGLPSQQQLPNGEIPCTNLSEFHSVRIGYISNNTTQKCGELFICNNLYPSEHPILDRCVKAA
jgi:hypothetical protein